MSFHISRTPFRISFFGGGTDFPEWYRANGGAVLSTTIDKYCYISCRYLPPFFDVRHRIVWSHIENVQHIGEILHPAVREGLRFLGFDDSQGLEIHYQADLPARAGMGSSSAFAVGFINALSDLRGEKRGAMDLCRMAIELEREKLKEIGGVQDQMAVALGGLNILHFKQDGEFEPVPVRISAARRHALEENLLLFFTGTSRLSSHVAAEMQSGIASRGRELSAMRKQVDTAVAILENDATLDTFGRLLDEAWEFKRQLSKSITTSEIDRVYRIATENGALGGKLLGAGGSGFMLFYIPPHKQEAVRDALRDKLCVPFKFENEGSTILYRPKKPHG